jgi:hypothetical protein
MSPYLYHIFEMLDIFPLRVDNFIDHVCSGLVSVDDTDSPVDRTGMFQDVFRMKAQI